MLLNFFVQIGGFSGFISQQDTTLLQAEMYQLKPSIYVYKYVAYDKVSEI